MSTIKQQIEEFIRDYGKERLADFRAYLGTLLPFSTDTSEFPSKKDMFQLYTLALEAETGLLPASSAMPDMESLLWNIVRQCSKRVTHNPEHIAEALSDNIDQLRTDWQARMKEPAVPITIGVKEFLLLPTQQDAYHDFFDTAFDRGKLHDMSRPAQDLFTCTLLHLQAFEAGDTSIKLKNFAKIERLKTEMIINYSKCYSDELMFEQGIDEFLQVMSYYWNAQKASYKQQQNTIRSITLDCVQALFQEGVRAGTARYDPLPDIRHLLQGHMTIANYSVSLEATKTPAGGAPDSYAALSNLRDIVYSRAGKIAQKCSEHFKVTPLEASRILDGAITSALTPKKKEY